MILFNAKCLKSPVVSFAIQVITFDGGPVLRKSMVLFLMFDRAFVRLSQKNFA